ncbi:restriction endonuclease subunit S [Klebsiella sp. CN_Kp104]|uniref:restriction endonuclease subunit S n=1 Tax=Klebsiella sp. CN_Kp104 TaxID=3153423 RepID=UPI00277B7EC1|nr:restriction endonuclease subunit S [Klebsiella aerogenes]
MAKYKAYPKYKDSGVEWLGLVPESWTVCRLKNLATIKNGQDYKSVQTDDGYPVMGSGGQFTFASKFMYDKPSVLLGRKGTIDKPLYINEPFWTVDTMYYTELNEGFDAKYLHYLALTIQFSRYSTNTALPSMTQEHLSNYKFSVPKAESERKKITEFLDLETAKIDNLIEKQQQLIELLKEKRQAVISHAVTKGLNPDVPMKDSGVEWLGDVPEHWIIKRLKHISPKVGVGLVINPSTYTKDEGVYFIFGGDVKEFGFDLTKTRRISPQDSNKLLPSRLNSRDLVSVRVGYPGITSVVTDDLEGSNCASIIIIRRGSYNSDWLCAAMNVWVGRQQVDLSSYGAAQKQFNVSDAIEFVFPVPPINEQNDIADFVQKTLNKFDDLTQKAFIQIELLQERRTALISAAVTGKIDVRDWVAPDTQNVEEPQEATA